MPDAMLSALLELSGFILATARCTISSADQETEAQRGEAANEFSLIQHPALNTSVYRGSRMAFYSQAPKPKSPRPRPLERGLPSSHTGPEYRWPSRLFPKTQRLNFCS